MTNKERIKGMSALELARLLVHEENSNGIQFITPDGNNYETEEGALLHTIHWLNSQV